MPCCTARGWCPPKPAAAADSLPLWLPPQVWGKVMGLDFFPIYCAIVVAFAAACQHLFLVRPGRA